MPKSKSKKASPVGIARRSTAEGYGRRKIIVAMVGLVGSGKSTVANYLAPPIGAEVVDIGQVRMVLRKLGKGYDSVREIAEKYAMSIINQGKSVVIAGDFIDKDKRLALERSAKKIKAKVIYLRVVSDRDVMIGRLISAKYTKDSFFGGAGSNWRGPNSGAVVAIREMWRRTPNHYDWLPKNGGRFTLKKLPIKFIAEVDTTANWQAKIRQIAKKLRVL